MPCSDGGVPYPPSREEVLNSRMPAVLCGLVSVIGLDAVLATVDWKEAGVSQGEFREWWAMHQRQDAQRRAREADQKRRQELRAQAEAKLTPEERAVLGIK